MKLRKFIVFFLIIIFCIIILGNSSFVEASTMMESIKNGMSGVNKVTDTDTQNGIGKILNVVIGLLQIIGSGVSLIVITMLGIKYLVSSVGEKAEIKQKAVPIVIGCVLLFGAVNLIAALESFTNDTVNKK